MLDGHFSTGAAPQNGAVPGNPTGAAGAVPVAGIVPAMVPQVVAPSQLAPVPGISLIVSPSALLASPPTANKWIVNGEVLQGSQEGKKIQIGDNMTTVDRVILCASEVCGTAILVFLGCAGCIDFSRGTGGAPSHLQVCMTFGLAVMVAVQCFGHISGSHINPIVTVAAATLGNIPLVQVPIYLAGQLIGALAGFGLLKIVTPEDLIVGKGSSLGVCSPGIAAGVTTLQGLLVEFILCFILTLVCCGVWDSRNNTKHDSVPIRFGFAIAVLALAGGPYTGANMNPARSFAPALINGDWGQHWVYWVGPLGAGFVGALFYRFLFGKENIDEEDAQVAEVIPLNENNKA